PNCRREGDTSSRRYMAFPLSYARGANDTAISGDAKVERAREADAVWSLSPLPRGEGAEPRPNSGLTEFGTLNCRSRIRPTSAGEAGEGQCADLRKGLLV